MAKARLVATVGVRSSSSSRSTCGTPAKRRCRSPTPRSSASRRPPSISTPRLIAAVIDAESHFEPRPSTAGAQGLMQLLPSTAYYLAQLSGGNGFTARDLATPAVNIAYGSYYLRYLAGPLRRQRDAGTRRLQRRCRQRRRLAGAGEQRGETLTVNRSRSRRRANTCGACLPHRPNTAGVMPTSSTPELRAGPGYCERDGAVQARLCIHSYSRPAGGDHRARRRHRERRALPDASRRHRDRQDDDHGRRDRGRPAPLAGHRAQQDARRAALQRVPDASSRTTRSSTSSPTTTTTSPRRTSRAATSTSRRTPRSTRRLTGCDTPRPPPCSRAAT